MNSSSDLLEELLDEMTSQNGPQELAAGLAILMKLFNKYHLTLIPIVS